MLLLREIRDSLKIAEGGCRKRERTAAAAENVHACTWHGHPGTKPRAATLAASSFPHAGVRRNARLCRGDARCFRVSPPRSLAAAGRRTARPPRIPDKAIAARRAAARARAGRATLGYEIVESLTTEVGPRLAGSEADARAVAVGGGEVQGARLRQGLDRAGDASRSGSAAASTRRCSARHAQPLHADRARRQPRRHGRGGGRALRRPGRAAGRARRFARRARSPSSTTAWSARATAPVTARVGKVRSRGPSAAIRAGAVGYLMRSAGTDSHRNPHTGITRFDEGLTPIPSAALATPDADQLSRLLARGTGPRARRARLRLGRRLHLAQRDRRDPRPQQARRSRA